MEVFRGGMGFGLSSAERHLAREKRAISHEMSQRITGKMPVPRYFASRSSSESNLNLPPQRFGFEDGRSAVGTRGLAHAAFRNPKSKIQDQEAAYLKFPFTPPGNRS
jgi:hypothetical protein